MEMLKAGSQEAVRRYRREEGWPGIWSMRKELHVMIELFLVPMTGSLSELVHNGGA